MENGDKKLVLLSESVLTGWVEDYLQAKENGDAELIADLVGWAKSESSGLWARILKDGRVQLDE